MCILKLYVSLSRLGEGKENEGRRRAMDRRTGKAKWCDAGEKEKEMEKPVTSSFS